MNAGGSFQRIRDPSHGDINGPQRPSRSQEDGVGRGISASSVPSVDMSGAERAQKFEDEKKRIIDSCFSKKDAEGSCQCTSTC